MNEPTGRMESQEGGRQFGAALLAGLIVALIMATGAYFLLRGSGSNGPANLAPLPMGSDEQSYAPQILFTDIEMGRAANFLKQEVTSIAGIVRNNGRRNIAEMEVTLEFHDISQKVVLREKQRLYGGRETPLAPGGLRAFQFSFEDIPDTWNQAPPAFIVTGLRLQ